MNTQDVEISLLAEDDLDAVAGGRKNYESLGFAFMLQGFESTCGAAGRQTFSAQFTWYGGPY